MNRRFYEDRMIFHGVLYSRTQDFILDKEDYVYFRLLSCEKWEDTLGGNEQVNPYWVKLDKKKLSKIKLNRILKDRETVNNQSKEDYKNRRKDNRTNAYVFFLGNAPTYKDPYTFEVVEDYISFRYTQINYPEPE